MPDGPVQVVLNPQAFREDRQTPQGGGAGKDFFKGDNDGFGAHQRILLDSLQSILASRSTSDRINLKVQMRPDALAKSHRPFRSLFTSRRATHVGTGTYGELIFAVDRSALGQIVALIQRAEIEVMWRTNSAGVSVYSPSPSRSESSAIERVGEWNPAEERGFSLGEAEGWLAQAGSGKVVVEFLDLPAGGSLRAAAIDETSRLALIVAAAPQRLSLAANMDQSPERRSSPSALEARDRTRALAWSDQVGDVRASIAAFEASSVVKRVRLQDRIEAMDGTVGRARDDVALRPEQEAPGRAVVGVIDGGAAGPFSNSSHWIAGRTGLLAPEHRGLEQVNHGTQITSLVSMGSVFNPNLLPPDEDCRVYDLDLFPAIPFRELYYAGLDEFLDEVRASVERARAQTGARIFNLSYNLRRAPGGTPYSLAAEGLDRIAVELDVIFVISAGNLTSIEEREEWPARPADALAMLARTQLDDGILAPAESITNVSVGSVNPEGMLLGVEGAPTRYSRRSISVPSATKPDFAAIGGGTPSNSNDTSGLIAVDSFGVPRDVKGTSFAAPLVARYLASLDRAIATDVSRELLLAVATHNARVPVALQDRRLRTIAPSFVGRGVLPTVAQTLDGDPHMVSIVISDTIRPGKCVEFPFTWPSSLVTADGKCRGVIRLTLATQPTIHESHGWERVRVNLDAALKQASSAGTFNSRVEPTHQFFSGYTFANERTLSTELGKWYPIKSYERVIPRGIGESSDWRLDINYLTRAGVVIPESGIAFAAVVTIADPDGEAPVYEEMRRSLTSIGVSLSDLRTAVRVGVGV